MNRKIALSSLSILTTLVMLGSSAYATFVTNATLTGNTFSTTNPLLNVSTNGVDYAQTETGFTETGITPGAAGVVHAFNLQNADPDANATMALTGQIIPTSGDATLESSYQVRLTCDNGTDTGYIPMSTWISTPQSLNNLAPLAITHCTFQITLLAGDTVDANKSITFNTQFNASVGQ